MLSKISGGVDALSCFCFFFSPRTAVSVICLWCGFRVSQGPKVMKERRETLFSEEIL